MASSSFNPADFNVTENFSITYDFQDEWDLPPYEINHSQSMQSIQKNGTKDELSWIEQMPTDVINQIFIALKNIPEISKLSRTSKTMQQKLAETNLYEDTINPAKKKVNESIRKLSNARLSFFTSTACLGVRGYFSLSLIIKLYKILFNDFMDESSYERTVNEVIQKAAEFSAKYGKECAQTFVQHVFPHDFDVYARKSILPLFPESPSYLPLVKRYQILKKYPKEVLMCADHLYEAYQKNFTTIAIFMLTAISFFMLPGVFKVSYNSIKSRLTNVENEHENLLDTLNEAQILKKI